MRDGTGARRRRVVAAATLVAALAVPGLVLVAPAGAQSRPAPVLCARAQTQWARLVTLNTRAKVAFQRAEALQAQLTRAGRARLGHRLDTRLQYLRQVHAQLVARVAAIEARVRGRCSARRPVLARF